MSDPFWLDKQAVNMWLLQVDLQGHSRWATGVAQLSATKLRRKFAEGLEVVLNDHGFRRACWAGDGGLFVSPSVPEDETGNTAIRAADATHECFTLWREEMRQDDLLSLRVTVHRAEICTDEDPSYWHADELNWFMKSERLLGQAGSTVVTEEAYRWIVDESLRGRFEARSEKTRVAPKVYWATWADGSRIPPDPPSSAPKETFAYEGAEAFGEDSGTLQIIGAEETLPIDDADLDSLSASASPVVWFVDDERSNREWFRENHRDHFSVLTFSSRSHFRSKLIAEPRARCDAVVTDVFFPAAPVTDNSKAERLLAIYDEIKGTEMSEMESLWASEESNWSLDGFAISSDATEAGVPVFLFSRKATLLLSVDDLMHESGSVGNSHWLLEKVDPRSAPSRAMAAAQLQYLRIKSILSSQTET